mmetsp:Transcript_8521/g.17769  ORF Transcript_8521/g.17769 Transcript_8521/m.17769 type:complete len:105 (+) Transcript_8521:1802-2116(+)
MGGTALVHGSHKLSVSAMLLSDDGDESTVLHRKEVLQLKTIRPSLDVGDVVIFDNRTLHYGLANTSCSESAENSDTGRRPLLYLNVTQSWFHDPKNWDNFSKIF